MCRHCSDASARRSKQCPGCKFWYFFGAFDLDSTARDKHQSYCRRCHKVGTAPNAPLSELPNVEQFFAPPRQDWLPGTEALHLPPPAPPPSIMHVHISCEACRAELFRGDVLAIGWDLVAKFIARHLEGRGILVAAECKISVRRMA